jgi:hypothetical protein
MVTCDAWRFVRYMTTLASFREPIRRRYFWGSRDNSTPPRPKPPPKGIRHHGSPAWRRRNPPNQ